MNTISVFSTNNPLHWLILLTAVMLLLSVIMVVLILTFQIFKKHRIRREFTIESELNNWLAEVLLDEDKMLPALTPRLALYFKNSRNHSFITGKLITIRKNISGKGLANISQIYLSTGLKESSVNKLRSLTWAAKTKGIYELYMMDQHDMDLEIRRYTNSSNEIERMEAQIAALSFSGFEGLQFLDTLTHPLTEWQQLKLDEQLEGIDVQPIKGLEEWLRSGNHYVVRYALKLTANYQQLQVHQEVADCLYHEDEKIRTEAIMTLASLANPSTAGILIKHYEQETTFNKSNILSALRSVAGEEEIDFLLSVLLQSDNDLKLQAAIVLGQNTKSGVELLYQKGLEEPEPYQAIFLHVKREMSL